MQLVTVRLDKLLNELCTSASTVLKHKQDLLYQMQMSQAEEDYKDFMEELTTEIAECKAELYTYEKIKDLLVSVI